MPAEIDWRKLHGGAFDKKHALVTGGAGFIGSHLVDALLALGARVTVIDDLSTGHKENVRSDVKFIQGEALSRASAARRVHTATLLDSGRLMSLA